MSEKMPESMTEEAVAEWLHNIAAGSNPGMQVALRARAVLALVEAKASVALNEVGRVRESLDDDEFAAIVARVMGKEEKS